MQSHRWTNLRVKQPLHFAKPPLCWDPLFGYGNSKARRKGRRSDCSKKEQRWFLFSFFVFFYLFYIIKKPDTPRFKKVADCHTTSMANPCAWKGSANYLALGGQTSGANTWNLRGILIFPKCIPRVLCNMSNIPLFSVVLVLVCCLFVCFCCQLVPH